MVILVGIVYFMDKLMFMIITVMELLFIPKRAHVRTDVSMVPVPNQIMINHIALTEMVLSV